MAWFVSIRWHPWLGRMSLGWRGFGLMIEQCEGNSNDSNDNCRIDVDMIFKAYILSRRPQP